MTLPASAAVNVSGARGALVGLAMLIESDSQFSMEGDLMIWVDGCGRAGGGWGGGGGGGVAHGTGGRGCVDARVRERSPSRAFAFASAWRAAVRHGAPRPAAVAQAVRASAPHPGRQSALDFLVVAFCGRAVHRCRAALARRTYAARRGDGPQVSLAGGVGVGTGGLVPRGALLLD